MCVLYQCLSVAYAHVYVYEVFVCGWPYTHCSCLPSGCPGMWDNITCWKPAHVGEMVLVTCPELFRIFNPDQGR
jgi:hypothetical protein